MGLEFIAAVVSAHTQTLDIVDMSKEAGRTKDFLRPETDMVCFSVNWDRDAQFLRVLQNKIFGGGQIATDIRLPSESGYAGG